MTDGKHTATGYVEITPDLSPYSGAVRGLKATKLTQNKPQMQQGKFYVQVNITLPDDMWKRVVPKADIDIPLDRTGTVEVEVEPVEVGPEESA